MYERVGDIGSIRKAGMGVIKTVTVCLANYGCPKHLGSYTTPREASSEVTIFIMCLRQRTVSFSTFNLT